MEARFFRTQEELRRWLEENHGTAKELEVGFYKKGSGEVGITFAQAKDEALCFGWIDSIRKGIDDKSYMNRFTPRKPGSNWSEGNIRRAGELIELGAMHPAGLKAFNARER